MFYSTLLRIYCLCWCLYLLNNCQGQKVTEMNFREFRCVLIDPTFANITKCLKKDITKSISETTVNITLFEEIKTATIKLYFRKKKNDKYIPFYHDDILVDGCLFLKTAKASPIARYIFAIFKDYSNVNHTCPFKDYILIDRCRVDMKSFKWVPVPVGEYFFNSEWIINGKRRYDFGVVVIIT